MCVLRLVILVPTTVQKHTDWELGRLFSLNSFNLSVCVCTRLLRMNSALWPRPTLEDDDEDVSSTSLVLGLSKFSFLIYNHQAPLYKMPLGFDSNHIHTVGAL